MKCTFLLLIFSTIFFVQVAAIESDIPVSPSNYSAGKNTTLIDMKKVVIQSIHPKKIICGSAMIWNGHRCVNVDNDNE